VALWLAGGVLATRSACSACSAPWVYDLARREGIAPFKRLGLVAAAAARRDVRVKDS